MSAILFKGMGIPGTRFLLEVGMPGTWSLLWGRYTWFQLTSRRVGMSKGWYVQEMVGMSRVCLSGGGYIQTDWVCPEVLPRHLVAVTTHTVNKRTVRILLEYFLVFLVVTRLTSYKTSALCSTMMLSPNMRSMHFKDTNLDVLRVTEYIREDTSKHDHGNWLHSGT